MFWKSPFQCADRPRERLRSGAVQLSGRSAGVAPTGTVEDVFLHLADVPLSGEREDLNTIGEIPDLIPSLNVHRQFNGLPRGRTKYRVIVQASMQGWQSYRRNQMQGAVERAVHRRFPKWRLVPDDAHVELWLQQTGRQVRLGLRLTDRTMRHRTYKIANRPASLRPTIARALVQLTRPEDGDVFLDPMCGAGTVMIERALAGRYALVQGGDIDEQAVAGTLENFGNRHKPRDVYHWDARQLPLPHQSVDKVATNPPWGRQVGSVFELRTLYASAFAEIDRVLRPNGVVAVLSSEWNAIKSALAQTNLTLIEQIKDIAVLGRRADILSHRSLRSNPHIFSRKELQNSDCHCGRVLAAIHWGWQVGLTILSNPKENKDEYI